VIRDAHTRNQELFSELILRVKFGAALVNPRTSHARHGENRVKLDKAEAP